MKHAFHAWMLLWLLFSNVANAQDLVAIYQQACACDPVFQSARAAYLAAAEALPQSRANLLPNANLTANTTRNNILVQPTEMGMNFLPAGLLSFNSNAYAVTLTQPLFNFASWVQFKQAKATVKQACATYGAALQDLVIRVAQAYFAVLLAQDNLTFIQAKKHSLERQLYQIRERYKVGLETAATLDEAKASYDSTVSAEIGAQNDLVNSFEKLKQITGVTYCNLATLKKDLPLLSPKPNNSDQWICAAQRHNLLLIAARYGMQAAKEQIKINFAGHLPVINAVGIHEQQNGAIYNLANTKTDSAALQLTLPIYSGGAVNSQVRQAEYQYQKASADMETTHREVVSNTRQQFNNVITAISKVKADSQAVISNQTALKENQAGFDAGTQTIVDVLLAEQNLLNARQVYSSDQYNYLINTLLLKQAAGILTPNDLCSINRWLTEAHSVMPVETLE
jgi:outer membrane protein